MSSSFGSALKIQIFGQSHASGCGCVIEGLPAGLALDMDALQNEMKRRSPGQNSWSTKRKEADEVEIVSGLNAEGETSGAPLTLFIANTNTQSADYKDLEHIPRPGHADFPASVKWDRHADIRGGGHFSGRLTAPLVAAGAIAKQYLAIKGIVVCAHALSIADISDEKFVATSLDEVSQAQLQAQIETLQANISFPTINPQAAQKMIAAITEAQEAGDSVGGIIECVATGLPVGLGEPLFEGIEAQIAHVLFGVGAIKGLEFGAGFAAASMRGSEHNDPYTVIDGHIQPTKNDAGGNLGGLTTGAPLLLRAAVKPTSSISLPQASVDLDTSQNCELIVNGRHDPCIVGRAVVVVEACVACVLLDSILMNTTATLV